MKTKFNNSAEVCHKFAERSQPEGRSSNVFFYSDKIYSYGYHYLLAEFIKSETGETAIMINDKGYSNTTAKHISEVRQATRQYMQWFTTNTDKDLIMSRFKHLIGKLQNARKPELYLNEANSIYSNYCLFCVWKGISTDTQINSLYAVFTGKKYIDYLREEKERIEKENKERLIREQKEQKESIKKFYAGKIDYIYHSSFDYVRLSNDKTMVETSQRVKVTVKEAKVLYALIQAKKDIKGFNIGGYTVISINGTLKIGCHNIDISSVNKVGKQLMNM